MKTLVSTLIVLLTLAGSAICQELKTGMVALEVIIQNYPRFREVDAQLQREMTTYQVERKTWESDMERLKKDIEKKEEYLRTGKMLSDQRKSQLANELDSLTTDFQMRINKKSTEEQEYFANRRNVLLADVLEEVNEYIKQIGEENGFDLIFDATNGTVVYAKDPVDLNDQLLMKLQKK